MLITLSMRNGDARSGQRPGCLRDGALADAAKLNAGMRMRLPAPAGNVVSSRNALPGAIAKPIRCASFWPATSCEVGDADRSGNLGRCREKATSILARRGVRHVRRAGLSRVVGGAVFRRD